MIVDLFPTPMMILNIRDELLDDEVARIGELWPPFTKRYSGYDPDSTAAQDFTEAWDKKKDEFDYRFLDVMMPGCQLKSTLEKYANKFIHDAWGELTSQVAITTTWLNIYEANEPLDRHAHLNSIVSGTLYLSAVPEHGPFNVHSPSTRERMILGRTEKHNRFTRNSMSFYPKQWDLYLFPSSLEHSVGVHHDPSIPDRCSLSFNTFYSGHFRPWHRYGHFNEYRQTIETVQNNDTTDENK